MSKGRPSFPEEFLHFIWMNQYMDRSDLSTTDGLPVEVFHPGYLNREDGPDFAQAKILVDGIEWAGKVEIHIKSSDWYAHSHQEDPSYDSVILHVVWHHDKPVQRRNGTLIPTLEIGDRIDKQLIDNYKGLSNLLTIPCRGSLHLVSDIVKKGMIEKAGVERIARRTESIFHLLRQTINNWHVVFLRLFLTTLAFGRNRDLYEYLARITPWDRWQRFTLLEKESVLLGQAGLLFSDDDLVQHRKEHAFLRYKLGLPKAIEKHQWSTLRLRPTATPAVRLLQFCSITHERPFLLRELLQSQSLHEVFALLSINPKLEGDHSERTKLPLNRNRSFGSGTLNRLIVNLVVPLFFAYGEHTDMEEYKIKGLGLLESLAGEKNRITEEWAKLGLNANNAFESQGLIELEEKYCRNHLCLNCRIGSQLLVQNVA